MEIRDAMKTQFLGVREILVFPMTWDDFIF